MKAHEPSLRPVEGATLLASRCSILPYQKLYCYLRIVSSLDRFADAARFGFSPRVEIRWESGINGQIPDWLGWPSGI